MGWSKEHSWEPEEEKEQSDEEISGKTIAEVRANLRRLRENIDLL